jgi:F-type H+-transporting ATPase subunit epsilon
LATLTLEIVTPESRVLSEAVDEVIVPGFEGLFGVRPGHAPLLSIMEPGTLTFKQGSTSKSYFVAGGFVQVAANKVQVLADQAEACSSIDVGAAQKRLQTAQEKLKSMSSQDSQFETERAKVHIETARMVAARHR